MPRTLMPTPDDAEPDPRARVGCLHYFTPEEQAVLDFLLGDYVIVVSEPAADYSALFPPASLPLSREPHAKEDRPPGDEALTYLPVASACYAIVQYSPATASAVVEGGCSLRQEPLIRRVVGLFADIPSARQYAMQNYYQSYDVVPATAVIATPPLGR
jgi:hypothetical protein